MHDNQGHLGAFWSRATKTIPNHVQEVRKMAQYGQMLQYLPMPVSWLWDLHSHLGMDAAIMVLMRSMEKGKAGATVKYGTARKTRATLTILWESSPLGADDVTLSARSIKGQFIATLCPSEDWWCQHYKARICARMGDVVSQDKAYTIEVVLALLEMLEEEWQTFLFADSPALDVCLHVPTSILPWWDERF